MHSPAMRQCEDRNDRIETIQKRFRLSKIIDMNRNLITVCKRNLTTLSMDFPLGIKGHVQLAQYAALKKLKEKSVIQARNEGQRMYSCIGAIQYARPAWAGRNPDCFTSLLILLPQSLHSLPTDTQELLDLRIRKAFLSHLQCHLLDFSRDVVAVAHEKDVI